MFIILSDSEVTETKRVTQRSLQPASQALFIRPNSGVTAELVFNIERIRIRKDEEGKAKVTRF